MRTVPKMEPRTIPISAGRLIDDEIPAEGGNGGDVDVGGEEVPKEDKLDDKGELDVETEDNDDDDAG